MSRCTYYGYQGKPRFAARSRLLVAGLLWLIAHQGLREILHRIDTRQPQIVSQYQDADAVHATAQGAARLRDLLPRSMGCEGFEAIFREVGRHYMRAVHYREFSSKAFCEWREVRHAHIMIKE